MKLFPAHVLIPIAMVIMAAVASLTMAQTPSAPTDPQTAPVVATPPTQPVSALVSAPPDPAVTALMQQLVQQQAQMVENQTQIETRIAALAEDIRQARIFARRGGGGGGSSN